MSSVFARPPILLLSSVSIAAWKFVCLPPLCALEQSSESNAKEWFKVPGSSLSRRDAQIGIATVSRALPHQGFSVAGLTGTGLSEGGVSVIVGDRLLTSKTQLRERRAVPRRRDFMLHQPKGPSLSTANICHCSGNLSDGQALSDDVLSGLCKCNVWH